MSSSENSTEINDSIGVKNSADFDDILSDLFTTFGGEYLPPIEVPYDIELTMESGQSIWISESDRHELILSAVLGPCPLESEKLTLILIASGQELDQAYPIHFFTTEDAQQLRAVISLPLQAGLSVETVKQGLERLTGCCDWFERANAVLTREIGEQYSVSMKV